MKAIILFWVINYDAFLVDFFASVNRTGCCVWPPHPRVIFSSAHRRCGHTSNFLHELIRKLAPKIMVICNFLARGRNRTIYAVVSPIPIDMTFNGIIETLSLRKHLSVSEINTLNSVSNVMNEFLF